MLETGRSQKNWTLFFSTSTFRRCIVKLVTEKKQSEKWLEGKWWKKSISFSDSSIFWYRYRSIQISESCIHSRKWCLLSYTVLSWYSYSGSWIANYVCTSSIENSSSSHLPSCDHINQCAWKLECLIKVSSNESCINYRTCVRFNRKFRHLSRMTSKMEKEVVTGDFWQQV